MKQREFVEAPTELTWDNVAAVLRDGAPDGFCTSEIAEMFKVDYREAGALLRLMWLAGRASRVITGRTAGTTLYFHPDR